MLGLGGMGTGEIFCKQLFYKSNILCIICMYVQYVLYVLKI